MKKFNYTLFGALIGIPVGICLFILLSVTPLGFGLIYAFSSIASFVDLVLPGQSSDTQMALLITIFIFIWLALGSICGFAYGKYKNRNRV